jgi:hypothetical protein
MILGKKKKTSNIYLGSKILIHQFFAQHVTVKVLYTK